MIACKRPRESRQTGDASPKIWPPSTGPSNCGPNANTSVSGTKLCESSLQTLYFHSPIHKPRNPRLGVCKSRLAPVVESDRLRLKETLRQCVETTWIWAHRRDVLWAPPQSEGAFQRQMFLNEDTASLFDIRISFGPRNPPACVLHLGSEPSFRSTFKEKAYAGHGYRHCCCDT